jgi:ribose transport system substrate-binding protein
MDESRRSLHTRRSFLRMVGAAGAAGAALPLLEACSRDPSAAPTAAGGASGSPAASGTLAAFDPNRSVGSKPNLPPVIAWANYANIAFFERCTEAMKAASADVGLRFTTASAEGNVATNVSQIQGFLQRGVGALATNPIDPEAQRAVLLEAVGKGVCVIGNVLAPATMHDVAPQYEIGYRQGEAAAKYVNSDLGGEAQVLLFNNDKIAALQPKTQGVRDALKKLSPGARIVVDSAVDKDTKEESFQTASTALQRFPGINVVLGWDTEVLGSYSAFQAAGKLKDNMFFAGVDGEQQAIDLIKKGGAYKASFAWPMEPLAYAWTKFGADWLEGRSIPKVIILGVIELSSPAVINQFVSDMNDPKGTYLKLPSLKYLGNISYDTRQEYARDLYQT